MPEVWFDIVFQRLADYGGFYTFCTSCVALHDPEAIQDWAGQCPVYCTDCYDEVDEKGGYLGSGLCEECMPSDSEEESD